MTLQIPENRARTQGLDTLVDEIMAQNSSGLLAEDLTRWREDLHARLHRVQQHPEQNMGFIEETLRAEGHARQSRRGGGEMPRLPTPPLQQEAPCAENRRRLLR